MTCNGVVLPDLTWKPVAHELKQAYCPVLITKQDFNIWSYHSASTDDGFVFKQRTDAEPYHIIAAIREDGIIIKQEAVELPLSHRFNFSIPHTKEPGCIYTIEFSVRQTNSTFYADENYELGLFQFPLESIAGVNFHSNSSSSPISFTEINSSYIICGENFKIEFDNQTGELISFEKNDIKHINGGGLPNFNRPLTGLDAFNDWGWINEYAKVRGLILGMTKKQVFQTDGTVCITFHFTPISKELYDVSCTVRYTITSDGKIEVEYNAYIDPSYKAVPRVGLMFVIPPGFEKLEYLGLGPVENYCDRKLSAFLALHESTVEEQHFPFIPPSENGGHEETRRISLTNSTGSSIYIKSRTPFHFDIHHNTVQDYTDATHDHMLLRRPESYLHIDAMHAPIGSAMAWSTVMPGRFMENKGSYSLTFEIS